MPDMTIHNLEVTFEVEGDEDTEAFGRLFNRFIRLWNENAELQRRRERDAMNDRSLDDRPLGEGD